VLLFDVTLSVLHLHSCFLLFFQSRRSLPRSPWRWLHFRGAGCIHIICNVRLEDASGSCTFETWAAPSTGPSWAGWAAGTGPWRLSTETEQMLIETFLESSGKDTRPGNACGGSRLDCVGLRGWLRGQEGWVELGWWLEGCCLVKRIGPELNVLEMGDAFCLLILHSVSS